MNTFLLNFDLVQNDQSDVVRIYKVDLFIQIFFILNGVLYMFYILFWKKMSWLAIHKLIVINKNMLEAETKITKLPSFLNLAS